MTPPRQRVVEYDALALVASETWLLPLVKSEPKSNEPVSCFQKFRFLVSIPITSGPAALTAELPARISKSFPGAFFDETFPIVPARWLPSLRTTWNTAGLLTDSTWSQSIGSSWTHRQR